MEDHSADSLVPCAARHRSQYWCAVRNVLSNLTFLATLLALFAIPFIELRVWPFVVAFGVAYGFGLSVTIGYHRYFAHRSFGTSRAFQFLLALGGCLAIQKGPLWWVATHRLHHRHSDRPDDPHSPVQGGFWHAHVGWMFASDTLFIDYAVVKDLRKYPELVWLDRLWLVPGIMFAGLCYLTMGWAGVVIGYCMPLVLMLQATYAVNSICHLFGSRRFETPEQSRNNLWVALLTHGEGWHNNHHHAPYSARHGFAWYEFDLSYQVIRVLALLGVVWNVKLPPEHVMSGEDRTATETPVTV